MCDQMMEYKKIHIVVGAVRWDSRGIDSYANLTSSLYVEVFVLQVITNEGPHIAFKLGLQYQEECLL
jgi:hypothetical protein